MSENTAKTVVEWVFVAKSVAQLPYGENPALRCMARAGMAAQDVHDWITVSNAWAQNFNDTEMVQQCMDKAKSRAEYSDDHHEDWIRIGDAYLEMGHYDQAIKIYREFLDLRPWQYLVKLENMGPYPAGTTALDWVEPGMTARASRDSVLEAKEYIGNKPKEAIRCLLEAESFAERSVDWVRIAKVWKKDFQDLDSAFQCMEMAEESVDVCYDWIRIAKVLKNDSQDTDSAILRMESAEEFVGGGWGASTDEWELILETWKDDFQDPDKYLQCVEKAAEDLDDPWDCIGTALYDEFVYDCFIRKQSAIVDLGALTKFTTTRIGIWRSEWFSERQQGSYARYYTFTIPQAAEVSIFLSSGLEDTCLYLCSSDSPNGEVLDRDSGEPSSIKVNLPPATYTLEATTCEEKVKGIFILKIYVG